MAFKDLRYSAGGKESGPRTPVKLVICAVLLLLPAAAPGAQSLLMIFVPGLAACMLYKENFNSALAFLGVVFLTGSAISYMTGRPDSALWMVQGTGTALLIIFGLRHSKDAPEIFLLCTLFLCLTTFAAFALGSGFDLAEAYRGAVSSVTDELEASKQLYTQGSGQQTLSPELALWFQQLKEVIIRFFPGLVMTSMVMAAFLNTLVCRKCLAGAGEGTVPLSSFSHWKLPDWLVWPWIAAGAACFIPHSLYSTMGENSLLVFSAIFFVAGISVTQFLFERFSVPRWIRWITWVLIGIQWYGVLVLAALGLADVWVDFRKRFSGSEADGQSES